MLETSLKKNKKIFISLHGCMCLPMYVTHEMYLSDMKISFFSYIIKKIIIQPFLTELERPVEKDLPFSKFW